MPDRDRVIYDIERCICHVPDACKDCSHYQKEEAAIDCMEILLSDALALLREQEPVEREFVRGVKPEFRRGVPSCGRCGNVLANHYRNCPWCGCEVKWG